MTLRDRCKEFYQKAQQDAMLRQGSPVDDLMAFVLSEIGRGADEKLESTVPLCLYFGNEPDREEFVALMHEAKPGWITKRWPR